MCVDVDGGADVGVSEVARHCGGVDSLALEHGGEEMSELVWSHTGYSCLFAEFTDFFGEVVGSR